MPDLVLAHGYFLEHDALEQRVMKPYPPLGLLYISAHLKARGVSVSVFDSTFRTWAEFEDVLRKDRPRVVGLYCNLMTKRTVLRMIAACRAQGIQVVLGGPEPPYYAERYLDAGADVVVVGEGEQTLEELLPRLLDRSEHRDLSAVAGIVYRDSAGRVVHTPPRALIRDLDAQPLPDRDAIDLAPYLSAWRARHGRGSLSLLTARGCPFTCKWCSRSVFGETHRRRSVKAVADEAEMLLERWRPDMLWYVDDVFTIHRGFVLGYADEMARRGLHLPFECISRADRIDPDVADALRRLGCFRVWLGSESGSQRVLDAMDRRVSVEQVASATRQLQRNGIEVGMFIMLGYPGEDESDLRATVDHLKTTAPDVFLTTLAYPIRGTAYHDETSGALREPGPWTEWSDRDLVPRGRPTRLYYRFARQWMESEVARSRHWKARRWLRASVAATRAGAGRLGMTLLKGQREA
jgi:anaerobic magnesium-protoporphyrin IX monomethyl ester cyclase